MNRFRDTRKLLIFVCVLVVIGGFVWLYRTPYQLHAEYHAKGKLYEMDMVSKDDFEVYTTSRLGRVAPVKDFRLSSSEVSKTGLVSITSIKPKLGILVDLNSISVTSSEIKYNDSCREDEVGDYNPQVSELIHFADGSVHTMKGALLDVNYSANENKDQMHIEVEGVYDDYEDSFSMITVDSITTKTKISTKKTLSSDKLDLMIHYSDGTKEKLENDLVTSTKIEKPKKGTNYLTCYYNGKKYEVKVKGYEPEDKRPKVTFPGYGTYILQYSKPYEVAGASRLNTYVGVRHFYNHRETYYSLHSPGGYGTNYYIPGKHVAEDGTVRDQDGYICVASDYRFCRPYQVVLTTLGPAKVYDTGCAYGTIDLYVDWQD